MPVLFSCSWAPLLLYHSSFPIHRAGHAPQVLEFEQQYLQSLPLADMYEKSYMHRDTVVQVAVAHGPDFIITASVDGHIKFWKKQPQGIEFAKHFKAHLGPVTGLAVSNDGTLCASISTDKSVKASVGCGLHHGSTAAVQVPLVPQQAEPATTAQCAE